MKHVVNITEEERAMVLTALAHLSVEKPTWDRALASIAQQIDNVDRGRPVAYDILRAKKKQAAPMVTLA